MKSIILIAMLTVGSIMQAYEERPDKEDIRIEYSAGRKNKLTDALFSIAGIPAVVLGVGYLIYLYATGSSEKPCKSWEEKEWNQYLHKKFDGSNKELYAKHVVEYYEGYLHKGFCDVVRNFTFDESLFTDHKKFVRNYPFTEYQENELERYFNTLSGKERTQFFQGINSVIAARQKRIDDACEQMYRQQEAERIRKERELQMALCNRLKEQEVFLKDARYTYKDSEEYNYIPAHVMEARLGALRTGYDATLHTKKHTLSPDAQSVMNEYHLVHEAYATCVGSELQQVIHIECIAIIDKVASVSEKQLRRIVVDFAEVGREQNQAGFVVRACKALDVCWSVIWCTGCAIGSGVQEGIERVSDFATEVLLHPADSAMSFATGIVQAVRSLDAFIEDHPRAEVLIAHCMCGYQDERISLEEALVGIGADLVQQTYRNPYDAIKQTTALASEFFLSGKAFTALGKFFALAGKSAQPYLVKIKDGIRALGPQELPAALGDKFLAQEVIKNTNKIRLLDYGHSVIQYEDLKKALAIEQITSIIKVTEHGLIRLLERGFEIEEIIVLAKHPDLIRIQSDGAKAFIKKIGGKYNIMIINENTHQVVTGIPHTSLKKIQKLGKNYGWEL